MSSLGKARKLARQALESLYNGKCTIFEYKSIKDPMTKISKKQPVAVLTDQPCRLSIANVTSGQAGEVTTIAQVAKLFISPDVIINPGSMISVIQNGVTTAYTRSGQPAIYSNHQEISLELFKGWA